MTFWRLRILLTLLCLLTFATSTHAECAWVLWSQEVETEPGLAAEDKKAWRPISDIRNQIKLLFGCVHEG